MTEGSIAENVAAQFRAAALDAASLTDLDGLGLALERVALAWTEDYEDFRADASGRCSARRRLGNGSELSAPSPDMLNAAIRADWESREATR